MPDNDAAVSLLRSLPPVLRARDFHLYLEEKKTVKKGGRRNCLVDLWLYGGRALLGHKPPNQLRELKNTAERGLLVPFPHPQERRFIKALTSLFNGFPDRAFRVYKDGQALCAALEAAGLSYPETVRPLHPAFSGPLPLCCLLPVPHPLAPPVLVLDKSLEPLLPPGSLIPPAVLAVSTRAVYDLIAAAPEREKTRYKKIEKALARNDCCWRQEGIYLTRREAPVCEPWTETWKRFLESGFLLPPSPDDPLILPGILSAGEETKLAALLKPTTREQAEISVTVNPGPAGP
jgi:hypothetical protein